MKFFGLNDRLFDVEGSQTSIGADVADLEVENPEPVVDVEEDDKVLPVVEDEPEVDDEEETVEGEDDVEENEEEEDKPEPEVSHPFDRPTLKQLNEAFPDLFKKFPSMRDMYFRESEFTKIFPTVDDAKEASENNSAFSNIREDVFSGDGKKFFSAIKDTDPKGLEKFASRILPNLMTVHPDAFWRAANPFVEDVARQMFAKGTQEGNESMQNAARYLAKYFLGDTEFAEGKKTSVIKEEPSEVSKEREAWDNERHKEFYGKVGADIKAQIISVIGAKDAKSGKSRLDPDDVLSPFIRATIIDCVVKDLGESLQADKGHMKYMDSLWDHAKKNGRTEADKARIVSAYLARAKAMIPSLRSKYVSEALGKKHRDATQRKEKVASIRERGGTNGRPSSGGTKNFSPKAINYSKTSDADILNDDITYNK